MADSGKSTNSGSPNNEPFWTELVPREERTQAWLQWAASDLRTAARSWDSCFRVTVDDIVQHLFTPEIVVVLRSVSQIIGFVAVERIMPMHRTGLTARYIAGAIVHQSLGGKMKFARLMGHVDQTSGRADLELLHTQNPCMAVALAARHSSLFPSQFGSYLERNLYLDIQDVLVNVDRKAGFCPKSSICKGFYDAPLYGIWPIPGASYTGSFDLLLKAEESTSAILVIGFADLAVAETWVKECKCA